MKTAILYDFSSTIGQGHLRRMEALDEAFLDVAGARAQMFCIQEFGAANYAKAEELAQSYDIIAIDSYTAAPQLYSAVAKHCFGVYFDDFCRITYPARGLAVNAAPGSRACPYACKKALGLEYLLLRSPFWNPPQKEIKEEIESLIFVKGSADFGGLDAKMLRVLKEAFEDAEIIVLEGSGLDAKEVRALFLKSDLAVSAGGQSLLELCSLGVPTVAFMSAKNQVQNLTFLQKKGVALYAGGLGEAWFLASLRENLERIKSDTLRQSCHQRMGEIFKKDAHYNLIEKILREYEDDKNSRGV